MRALGGCVVGDGGGHHDHVGVAGHGLHGVVHLGRAPDAHHLDACGRVEARRARDEDDARAAARGLGGDRVPHLPARSVADVPHVVDVLVGRPGGDDDEAAEERALLAQQSVGGLDDGVGLGEPALADPAAGEIARAGIDEPHAARRERSMLRRTASCSSMFVFIAGAISTGARVARYSELRKSSAMPLANLPMTLAVAGATSSRAMSDASAMCSMSALAPGAHWSVMTRRRVIASKVTSPTNLRAERVMMATTSWSRFCSSRATSTAL